MNCNYTDHSSEIPMSTENPIEVTDAENLVQPLEQALYHAESKEVEYWIRTALQYLVMEDANSN
jgi:hypothetical protein